ncbi:MAG: hypothetical protein HYR71_09905, partial [Chloroflexi bacterium]|nr:hypothetical protein [Chloroflexota bacterium]
MKFRCSREGQPQRVHIAPRPAGLPGDVPRRLLSRCAPARLLLKRRSDRILRPQRRGLSLSKGCVADDQCKFAARLLRFEMGDALLNVPRKVSSCSFVNSRATATRRSP